MKPESPPRKVCRLDAGMITDSRGKGKGLEIRKREDYLFVRRLSVKAATSLPFAAVPFSVYGVNEVPFISTLFISTMGK